MDGEQGNGEAWSLEEQIDRQLAVLGCVEVKTQQEDVAISFLCRARSLAREGKAALAERQITAARNVLTGGDEDASGVEGADGAR